MSAMDTYKIEKSKVVDIDTFLGGSYKIVYHTPACNIDWCWTQYSLRDNHTGVNFNASKNASAKILHAAVTHIIQRDMPNIIAEAKLIVKSNLIALKAEAMKEAKEILDELSA